MAAVVSRFSASSRAVARLAAAGAAALLALLATASGASAGVITPESGGEPANAIKALYIVSLVLAILVFLAICVVLLYAIVKFRARRGHVAAQFHGNTRLEIGWTLAAAAIVIVITAVTFVFLPSIANPPEGVPSLDQTSSQRAQAGGGVEVAQASQVPGGPRYITIDVTGQQYIWRFRYPNDAFEYETMVAPVDTVVRLRIESTDVAHSWWIPKLAGKKDAVPGYTNYDWFRIPGRLQGQVLEGQCAELCGRNHANMIARVRAVSWDEYQRHIAQLKQSIEQANESVLRARGTGGGG
jgi:cytochrome c oxidase subunit 2